MANLNGLASIVSELKAERTSLASQLKQVDTALMALGKLDGRSSHTHTMSPAGRKRISLAQKRRWAQVRAGKVVSITSKRGKRKLSAAGRRRIALAQKARWAKVRAGKK
jgi:hypothetical protein